MSDVLTSITIAGFTVAYIVERADRMWQWEEDIYRAEHDALTGALTRYGLKTWMTQLSAGARSAGMIMAGDLDDFKWFNDTWGRCWRPSIAGFCPPYSGGAPGRRRVSASGRG